MRDHFRHSTKMVVGACLVLAGCSGLPGMPETVRVPVPVPCVGEPPARPATASDAELALSDDYHLVLGLALDRRVLLGYAKELEAVIAGCR